MFRARSEDTRCNRLEKFDILTTHLFGFECGGKGIVPQVYAVETRLPKTTKVMAAIYVSRQLGDNRILVPARTFEQDSSLGQKYVSGDWVWAHFDIAQRTAQGNLPSDLDIARLIYPNL